jgi:hypothetical protein
MAKYHDRMGVILKPKDYQRWLEEGEDHTLPLHLLRPYLEEEMAVLARQRRRGEYAKQLGGIDSVCSRVGTKKRRKPAKRAEPKKEPSALGLFE